MPSSIPGGVAHDGARPTGMFSVESLRGGCGRQGEDAAPVRVMVFVESEEAARAAATPLRSGLWGDHKVSVLLPHGEEPIQVDLPPTYPLLAAGFSVARQ